LLRITIDGGIVDKLDDDTNAASIEVGNGFVQLDNPAMNDSGHGIHGRHCSASAASRMRLSRSAQYRCFESAHLANDERTSSIRAQAPVFRRRARIRRRTRVEK
jgi:hypothetical protein